MNEQNKAFCGDAIAQLAVGELLKDCTSIGGLLSNKAMTFAYFDWCNMRIGKGTIKWKTYGTKFEAVLYDVYKEEGYEAAKKIVKEFLLPQKGKEQLSYQ